MSNIKAIDFANNVSLNKSRLIDHCRANAIQVSDDASLDSVVLANNSINKTTSGQGHKVEFRNIDGELVEPAQFVADGEDAVIPATNPSFDSDYLEFVEWYMDGSITEVTEDVLCLPWYRVKYDNDTQQRPTYLFCDISSSNINIVSTLQVQPASGTMSIDWGDGSSVETYTGSSPTHTYTTAGKYIIKIWCTEGGSYRVTTSQNTRPLIYNSSNQSAYQECLQKAYLGDRAINYSYFLAGNKALEYFTYPADMTNVQAPNQYQLYMCHKLKTLVLPKKENMTIHYWALSITPNSVGQTTEGSGYAYNYYHRTALKYILIDYRTPYSQGTTVTLNYDDFAGFNFVRFKPNFKYENATSIVITYTGTTQMEEYFFPAPSKITALYLRDISPASRKPLSINMPNLTYFRAWQNTGLRQLFIPETCTINYTSYGTDFSICPNLTEVSIASNYDKIIKLPIPFLTRASLIGIARNLKDNTGLTTKTITLSTFVKPAVTFDIFLDENGVEVNSSDTGAMSLLQYIQSKNWTVSFG